MMSAMCVYFIFMRVCVYVQQLLVYTHKLIIIYHAMLEEQVHADHAHTITRERAQC